MSYDLYFTKPEIKKDQFEGYFGERANYTLNNGQAWYENGDTGVYFSFEYSDEPPDDPEFPEGRVSFNLNFYRPHFFALEAEPELRAFVDRFQFTIFDPQNEGMGESAYNADGFFRGWSHGNEFGYRALLKKENTPDVVHTRSKDELESIWKWNFTRYQIQNKLGEDVFVPKIFFILVDGNLNSAVIWPDAISTLIPVVDALVIPRKETAPRRFLKRREDTCCIPFKKAFSVLHPFKTNDYVLPSILLPCPKTPASVVDFVKKLEPQSGEMAAISIDQVLNSEIVTKCKKG
jgi:hypothetical protein